jgi:uncharacterized protein (DUF983 family)
MQEMELPSVHPALSGSLGCGGKPQRKGPELPRRIKLAIANGLRGHCPACGEGKLFRAYLKVDDECPRCGEELHHHRADDAPPYMTIVVAGHVVVGMLVAADKYWPDAPLWLHAALWPAVALILSLRLLPIMKGGLIAYQWALRMHGFEHAGQSSSAPGKSGGK